MAWKAEKKKQSERRNSQIKMVAVCYSTYIITTNMKHYFFNELYIIFSQGIWYFLRIFVYHFIKSRLFKKRLEWQNSGHFENIQFTKCFLGKAWRSTCTLLYNILFIAQNMLRKIETRGNHASYLNFYKKKYALQMWVCQWKMKEDFHETTPRN